MKGLLIATALSLSCFAGWAQGESTKLPGLETQVDSIERDSLKKHFEFHPQIGYTNGTLIRHGFIFPSFELFNIDFSASYRFGGNKQREFVGSTGTGNLLIRKPRFNDYLSYTYTHRKLHHNLELKRYGNHTFSYSFTAFYQLTMGFGIDYFMGDINQVGEFVFANFTIPVINLNIGGNASFYDDRTDWAYDFSMLLPKIKKIPPIWIGLKFEKYYVFKERSFSLTLYF